MLKHVLNPDSVARAVYDRLCVRPLGFYAYEGAVPDYVANMFVFGARDIGSGLLSSTGHWQVRPCWSLQRGGLIGGHQSVR